MILGTFKVGVLSFVFSRSLSTDNCNWTSPQGVRGYCVAVSESFRCKSTSEYFCHFEKLIGVLPLVTTLLGFFYRKLADAPVRPFDDSDWHSSFPSITGR